MADFCELCNNLFQYEINTVAGEETIEMVCTSCGFKKAPNYDDCIKASSSFSNKTDVKIVPDMLYDRALPHTNGIKCLNEQCESNLNPELTDIVYLDYNSDKMLAYICAVCSHSWKNLPKK
jgi:hypothetical protein